MAIVPIGNNVSVILRGNLIQNIGILTISTLFFSAISNVPTAEARLDQFTQVAGIAQESPPVQALCHAISQECHDLCKALEGLQETWCYIGCVTAEQMRKLPLSWKRDVVPFVRDRMIGGVFNQLFG